MNTCKDCKFSTNPGEFAQCHAPQNIEPVDQTGFEAMKYRYKYCSLHRAEGWLTCRTIGLCGREGRWFKPKEAT